jgi:hypothetical protein
MTPQPPQTNDLRSALESAGRKLATALNDMQALEVQTKWVEVKSGVLSEDTAHLVASTRIELDGDTTVIVPLKDENGALVLDQALFDLHRTSVEDAIQYRTQMIQMVVDFVRQARPR